jgi:16S rRNA (adenine1518-N6/adenine1519-N6)-dimethyltransferase
MDGTESLSTWVKKRKERYGIQTSKLRGQHFLIDAGVVVKVVAAAELTPDDTVVEIGPGLGMLTQALLPKVQRLIAVELDPLFVKILREEFADAKNLEIVEGDVLQMRMSDVIRNPQSEIRNYKVVTNLPYNITSDFFRKFLTQPPHPITITAMIQREVAERIVSPVLSVLSLMCNLYAECKLVARVSSAAFAPPPKVQSAIVHLRLYDEETFKKKWGIEHGEAEDLLSFAAHFFHQPRKKMCGTSPRPSPNLGEGGVQKPSPYQGEGRVRYRDKCRDALHAIGESPDSRPAALSMEKWVHLWRLLR